MPLSLRNISKAISQWLLGFSNHY